MKRFRDILKEGHDSYPADDMTIKELRIALNSAEHILDMIEEGAMVQRWQISAIVKASEELASVCTSMRADHDENDEGEDEAHEYHFQMNFEEAQLDEMFYTKKVYQAKGEPAKWAIIPKGQVKPVKVLDTEEEANYRARMMSVKKKSYNEK